MPDGSNYSPLPRTMAALIERIAADPLLPPKRRRALVGAVRDVLRLIGVDLSREPNLGAVRSQLSRFSPRSAGLNTRTWANKLSFFRAALRYAQPARRKPSAMDPRYRILLRASLDKSMAVGLSRLFGWLSEAGVSPNAVNDSVIAALNGEAAEQARQVAAKTSDCYILAGTNPTSAHLTSLRTDSAMLSIEYCLSSLGSGWASSRQTGSPHRVGRTEL